MLSSLVGSAARVVVRFSDQDSRQTVSVRQADGRDEEQYLFFANDDISGTVRLHLLLCLNPLRSATLLAARTL